MFHELVVGAFFHNAAALQHADAPARADGGKAVGDDDARAVERVERVGHNLLGAIVKGARRLVEHKDFGARRQGPGNGKTLLLPAREPRRPLGYRGGEAQGQCPQVIGNACRLGRRPRVLLRKPRRADGDVREDVALEELGVLQNHADGAAQRLDVERGYVVAVVAYRPFLGPLKPQQKPHDRGLSAPACPHDGHIVARLNLEREALQDGSGRVVAESNVGKLDGAGRVAQRDATRARLGCGGEDGRERVEAGLYLCGVLHRAGQRHERTEHHAKRAGKRHVLADADACTHGSAIDGHRAQKRHSELGGSRQAHGQRAVVGEAGDVGVTLSPRGVRALLGTGHANGPHRPHERRLPSGKPGFEGDEPPVHLYLHERRHDTDEEVCGDDEGGRHAEGGCDGEDLPQVGKGERRGEGGAEHDARDQVGHGRKAPKQLDKLAGRMVAEERRG